MDTIGHYSMFIGGEWVDTADQAIRIANDTEYYTMAPVRTLGAVYAVADITLPLGTPVKDYLAEADAANERSARPAFT